MQQRTGLKNANKPELMIKGKSLVQSSSFMNDAAKLWNEAPSNIKDCRTQMTAKKYIKIYIKTLPI